ncbi:MAG: FAD-dependent oxidoreductase, partial [Candidatus Eisenbacteria bacterium]|nr:FAD-dependent oxidoreductase [Candidatus Eisenbacteria bacterium]
MKTTDVAVIGGGLVGLATALRLSETTLDVTLIDKGPFGEEASMAGAGMLTAQTFVSPLDPGTPSFALEHAHFYGSHQARDLYPVFVAKVEAMSGIEVPLELNGILTAAANATELKDLEAQVKWQTDQGLKARMLTPDDMESDFPGVASMGGAHFEQDGWVDNQALVAALREAVKGAGVTVLENCPVAPLQVSGGEV